MVLAPLLALGAAAAEVRFGLFVGNDQGSAGDPELVRRLARDQIVIECCLSSNEDTGAVKRGTRHPIHAFLEAGVPVALCCDNTTVSRTDQQRESVKAALVIGADAVEEIHRRAQSYTFIEPESALSETEHDL